MDKYNLKPNEKLYRAVLPTKIFLKEDGSISSGAFKDKFGLSVDVQMNRVNNIAVNFIRELRNGIIVSVTSENCKEKNIHYVYCPLEENEYHSELHRDRNTKVLTGSQAKYLAKNCIKETDKD